MKQISVDSVGKIHKIAYLLIFWQINTKLEIYWESYASDTTFVWSIRSKISPVETIFTKINTQHLWNHCGSSHRFYVSSVIAYTKDCGEKFQEVQKLIKSFLINSYFQHKLTEKDPFITTEKRQALVVLIMQMHN